ncbi:MAG: hypothetical protein QW717_06545 [Candidatus Bathyarchaeia archaeon]
MSKAKRKHRKLQLEPEEYLDTIYAMMTELNLRRDRKRRQNYIV